MEKINEFDDLVDFTLNCYDLTAKYRVFYLNPEEFAECIIGHRLYMHLGIIFMKENLKFLHDIYKDCPDYYTRYKEEIDEFKPADDIEYGRVLKISEAVNSTAACIKLDDLKDLDSPMPFGIINDDYSLFFDIKELKKDVDFVIIINENLFSKKVENDQKLSVIHEAFHIVEHLDGGISHHIFETEPNMVKILNVFINIYIKLN